ncbi:MAG: HNH endonuclease signature motif containing protein [Gammaproteobacteria bacterium]
MNLKLIRHVGKKYYLYAIGCLIKTLTYILILITLEKIIKSFFVGNKNKKFMIINPKIASPNLEFSEEFIPKIMTRFGERGKWFYIKGENVASLTEKEIKEKLVKKAISKFIGKSLLCYGSKNDSKKPTNNNSNFNKNNEQSSLTTKFSEILKNTKETEKLAIVRKRIGQDILRKYIIEGYEHRCAMCDVDADEVLIASHIIPWSKQEETRLDLRNVILLCGIHDQAFENEFITIKNDYRIKFLKMPTGLNLILKKITNNKLRLPKFKHLFPKTDYLYEHRFYNENKE